MKSLIFTLSLILIVSLPCYAQNFQKDCEGDHWISSVSNGGRLISLENGTKWLIDEIDTVTTSIWLATEEIIICRIIYVKDEKAYQFYNLINTDNDEDVSAEPAN